FSLTHSYLVNLHLHSFPTRRSSDLPILTKKFGKKPLTPFNIHFQVKPVTIAGNAHGIINNVLYIPLNLLILFMAKAAAKPTSTCPVIEKKVHLMEVKNAL